MVNQTLKDPKRIMDEIGVLIDRAMLQIVNAMRHIELNKATHNEIRRVDQLSSQFLLDSEKEVISNE